jgi:hypothetical protein
MSHSNFDRDTFQQFLANAYAVQQSSIDSRSLSALMELERLQSRGELDTDATLLRIVDSASSVANANGVAIALLSGDHIRYRTAIGTAASYIGRQVAASLTADNHSRREILRVEDAASDPRIEAAICRQFESQSLLILPIYQDRALAGVLNVMFSEPHSFSDTEVRTYRLMVCQIESTLFPVAEPKPSAAPVPLSDPIPQIVPLATPQTLLHQPLSVPPSPVEDAALQDTALLETPPLFTPTPDPSFPVLRSFLRLKPPSALASKILSRAKAIPNRQRNLAFAALAAALVVAFWTATIAHRRVAPEEAMAPPATTSIATTSIEQPPSTAPADVQPARPSAGVAPHRSVVRPKSHTTLTAKSARPSNSGLRRARVNGTEVDYIGSDVTVRHFVTTSATHPKSPTHNRVSHIGDDVTVRYFASSPPVAPRNP